MPRQEKDSLGTLEIPDQAYYGVQSQRAVENFPISGMRAHPKLIWGLAQIKKAAARVNSDLGILDKTIAKAIVQASDEVLAGKFADQFVVDVFQAGAGTSQNMNMNEVLANRALEILGKGKGDYKSLSPNDHVNMSQSTNDVIPTAIRLAALSLGPELIGALKDLSKALDAKAKEFSAILKSGRTHLQDATPIFLGQEFSGYADCVGHHAAKLEASLGELKSLGLGGTAVGTGINAHPEYRSRVVKTLAEQTKLDVKATENYFEAMQSVAPFTSVSGAIRNLALDMIRIANDFRLLGSGPMTGLFEIVLPPVQPGSSIMPGKVNPVMAEMLDMLSFHVMGWDHTIALAAQAGQLELNVMMPIIAWDLLRMLDVYAKGLRVFTQKCVVGIKANPERCREWADKSLSNVTALAPHIGYLKAAELAKQALAQGRPLKDIILEQKLLSKEELDKALKLEDLTKPGIH